MHRTQVAGAVGVAIEIRQVGSCVSIMVPDVQPRAIHHEDLAALQGESREGDPVESWVPLPPALQRGCEESARPPEGARAPAPGPAPTTPSTHFRPRPSRAALTSSSPFSAASCSGVPPHRSCEISAPCSRSQLSTLVWPRLAAKCMAVAPSWSCSDKLKSAKLTWWGAGQRAGLALGPS